MPDVALPVTRYAATRTRMTFGPIDITRTLTVLFLHDIMLQLINREGVDSPKDSITVKGTVTRLNPYPKDKPMWMYGDLLGVERSIGFRCRYDEAPKEEGEHIVLTGFLSVKDVYTPEMLR